MKIENWLSALHKPTRRVKRRGKSRSCESLEVKALLSVTMDFGADDGELEVKSSADDAIVIGASADGTDVLINGESTGVAPAQVRKLEVTGGPLANSIDISAVTDEVFSNLSTIELKGNAGDDTLVGS
ncbi:MAG: hypothetical protein AB8G99_02390, partial [Planctomycetaceae bacterium]